MEVLEFLEVLVECVPLPPGALLESGHGELFVLVEQVQGDEPCLVRKKLEEMQVVF